MVASFSPRQASIQRHPDGPVAVFSPGSAAPRSRRSSDSQPLHLIQGSLSSSSVARQAPWLAGLHRLADGTLAGLGLCMLGLSALTLHWQNHWGRSFQALESAQVLEHRLQESAAQLERHHLAAIGRPGQLVPTRSDQLIYLPTPGKASPGSSSRMLPGLRMDQVRGGY